MRNKIIYSVSALLLIFILNSCFKEIDTDPIPLPDVEEIFRVEHSIKQFQSFYRFYESTVLLIDTAKNTRWDLAFESAGDSSRVLLGWASFSDAVPSGKFAFEDLTQQLVVDLLDSAEWVFDDPSYVNNFDSLALTGHWENGEIWIQNRGTSSDNYYALQYVSSDETSYTFRYASVQDLDLVKEATVHRASAFNYVYFSYSTGRALLIEPDYREWDIEFTPYRGWWETDQKGIYSPFNMSGVMINSEAGVRVAEVFDTAVYFKDIDSLFIRDLEFTDQKGVIGADWKILGDPNSGNIFSMDTTRKYIIEKPVHETGEIQYYKMRMLAYRNELEQDHFPTVEFKFLGSGN